MDKGNEVENENRVTDSEILDVCQRVDVTYFPMKPNAKKQHEAKITFWEQASDGAACGHTLHEEMTNVSINDVFDRVIHLLKNKVTHSSESEWGKTIEPTVYELNFGELVDYHTGKYLIFNMANYINEMPSLNSSKYTLSRNEYYTISMHKRYFRINNLHSTMEKRWPNNRDIVIHDGIRYEVISSCVYGQYPTEPIPVMPFCFYKEGMFANPNDKYGSIYLRKIVEQV